MLILVTTGWLGPIPANAVELDTETQTAALDPQEIISPVLVDDVFGEMASTLTFENDTLLDIARAEELGLIELMVANPGVDRWYPGTNVELTLPTAHIVPDAPRDGIIVNLAELRLYFFHPEKGAFSFPIGVGKDGFSTPIGRTKIVRKKANPTWYPTKEKLKEDPTLPRVFPPGPDNPLGEFALYLGFPQYLIHGTAKPWGIGRRVSRGCIRMYPEDIAWLFENAKVGTPVSVVEQPVKFGRRNGTLYVEVHPTLQQIDEVEATGHFSPEPEPDYTDLVLMKVEDDWSRLDWASVDRAFAERRGYPIAITR